MNRTLLPFLAASLAALPWLRREAARTWLTASLAGLVLLLPTATVPGGVPSSAAVLANASPWSPGDAAPLVRSELGDLTYQIEPWLFHQRGELRAGRLPFWNPYQFSGAPFWSNGQSAPLFPLNWLFTLMPIAFGLPFLLWARGVIAALGAYSLARSLGVGERGSRLAAVAFALTGRLVAFALFPMANALCLAPWLLLATERLAVSTVTARRPWRLLALLAALQLVAGHPETAVDCAILFAVYLAARVGFRHLAVWGAYAKAWLVGGALAAPALLPLATTLIATARWQQWVPGSRLSAAQLGEVLARLFLPFAFGDPATGSYRGTLGFVGSSLFVGALATLFALVGSGLWRRDRRVAGLLAMAGAALVGGLDLPGARQLLDAMPVVGRGLHHYLLLGLALAVATLAGIGYDRWQQGEGARRVRFAAIALGAALGGIAAVSWRMWLADGRLASALGWSALWIAALALLRTMPIRWRSNAVVAAVLTAAVGLELGIANVSALPVAPVERLDRASGATRFLSGRPERVAATGATLRPNAALVLRLFDVRGDDPLKLARYERVYGDELGGRHPNYFVPIAHWDSVWLDRLGVRWVMTPPGEPPKDPSWRVVFAGSDAAVFERPTAWPLVRWGESDREPARGVPQEAGIQVQQRLPGRWTLSTSTPVGRRLVIAETWDPGWRATIDDRPVPVGRVDDLLIAIDVPAGERRVDLRYVPQGLLPGLALAGAALVVLLGGARRRRTPADRAVEAGVPTG
ncbi:MAG: YfhO family protein [Holophagales bacterium]|nr:MAG: YfhO family protein [Holophagales bacterium]